MPTFFEKKQLVTPGEILAEGDYLPGENTYVEAGKIYASRIGLVDSDNKKVNVVALRAFYVPKMGDIVIGTVIEVGFNGWTVNIKAPYTAMLRASDVLSRPFKPQNDELSQVLTAGDLIVAKIAILRQSTRPTINSWRTRTGKNHSRSNPSCDPHKDSSYNRTERFNDFHDKTRNQLPNHPWIKWSHLGHRQNLGRRGTCHIRDSKD